MALETELRSGENAMLNTSSCLELSEIIKASKNMQKVKYKNIGKISRRENSVLEKRIS